jgi:hypothetical protein
VRRLARPPVVYAAAVAAGVIALISAIEAWVRLQSADSSGGRVWETSDWLLSVALPALAIAFVITLSWLQRRVRLQQREAESHDDEPFSELLDEGESLPSTWLRTATRHRQARRQLDEPGPQSAAS